MSHLLHCISFRQSIAPFFHAHIYIKMLYLLDRPEIRSLIFWRPRYTIRDCDNGAISDILNSRGNDCLPRLAELQLDDEHRYIPLAGIWGRVPVHGVADLSHYELD